MFYNSLGNQNSQNVQAEFFGNVLINIFPSNISQLGFHLKDFIEIFRLHLAAVSNNGLIILIHNS